jgi:hypothetical protein
VLFNNNSATNKKLQLLMRRARRGREGRRKGCESREEKHMIRWQHNILHISYSCYGRKASLFIGIQSG